MATKDKGNIIISPFSAGVCMSLIANSCQQNQANAIADILHCNDLEALNTLSNKLIRSISHNPDITVYAANSVWYTERAEINESFRQTVGNLFCAQLNGVDFAEPQTADIINSWGADKTNRLITSVINEPLDPRTVMLWANAMYAAGDWADPFDAKETTRKTFFGRDFNSGIDMMFSESTFGYYGTELYSAVRLPFKGNKASMIFVQPDEGYTISDLTSQLDAEEFRSICDSWKDATLKVGIPKFDILQETNLTQMLTEMGMPDVIALTAFTEPQTQEFTLKQHNRIIVEENGVKASSVSITGGVIAPAPPKALIFDHPFVFFLYDESNDVILMSGRICNF